MSYFEERRGARRAIGFGTVLLLHLFLLWGFAVGLREGVVEVLTSPLEARIIETPPSEADRPPPPPPPPALDAPPPPFVPAPEVRIDVPREAAAAKAITAVQSARKVSNATPPRPDPARPNRKPPYPPSSKRMGEEGTVVLLLYVTVSGDVGDARVDRSSGFAKLDQAAVKQAKKSWHFFPAMSAGSPVAVWHRFAVTFRLEEG